MKQEEYQNYLENALLSGANIQSGVLCMSKNEPLMKIPIDPSVFFRVLGEVFQECVDEHVSFATVSAPYIYASDEALVALISILHALVRSRSAPLMLSFRQDEAELTLFFTQKETGAMPQVARQHLPETVSRAIYAVTERAGITFSVSDHETLSLSVPFYHAAAEVSYTATHERMWMYLERTVNDLYFLSNDR